MKYFVALIFIAMSTTAFAETPEPGTTPTPNPTPTNEPARGFKFECTLEMPGVGKIPDVRCEAKGIICQGFDLATLGRCENGDDKFAVHCSDGFKVWDEEARVEFDHGELTIIGKHDGNRAILRIEKRHGRHEMRERRFDAELVTSGDGSLFRGSGQCELDFLTPTHD